MVMQRFDCGGKLHITINPGVLHTIRIRIEHHLTHQPYVKIGLTDDMKDLIEDNRSATATSVCPLVNFTCENILTCSLAAPYTNIAEMAQE
jgi:hypothetical protein